MKTNFFWAKQKSYFSTEAVVVKTAVLQCRGVGFRFSFVELNNIDSIGFQSILESNEI